MYASLKRAPRFVRDAQSFIFGAVALLILTVPYSIYLTILSRNDAKEFLYFATGFNTRLEMFDFLVPLFTIVTFQAIALLTYSILRIGTTTILAVVGATVFLTSAQTTLVFMSSPLWDMVTVVPVLACLFLALLIVLIPTWSVLPKAEGLYQIGSRVFLIAIITVMFLSLAILIRIAKGSLGPITVATTLSLIIACGFVVFSFVIIFYRLRIYRALEFRREAFVLVTLTAVMSAVLMMAPWFNEKRFTQGPFTLLLAILILAPLFAPIKNQFRLRASLSLILLITLFASRPGGSTLTGSRFDFHMSSGWQSAPQLVSGMDSSSVLTGIPFTDAAIWAFVEQQGLSTIDFLLLLAPMFILVNLNYAFIAIHYLIGGTWLYPEPPVGAVGTFWDGRMLFVESVGMVSTAFGVLAILLLLKSHRRVGLFLLVLLILVVLLIAFSRPQMHQWWYVPIFGVWAMLYCLHRLFRWVGGTNSSFTRPIGVETGTLSTAMGKPAIFLRAFLAATVTGISIFSITAFSGFAGPKVSEIVSKIQNQAQGDALREYPELSWETVRQSKPLSDAAGSSPREILFEIPKDTSLIRIDVAGGCVLSNFKFAMQNEDDFATSFGTRYSVGRSSSKVAYLPVIQTGEQRISRLFVQGTPPVCETSVAVVPVPKGEQPIVAWLPTSCQFEESVTSICSPRLEEGSATQQLFPPVNFEGYLAPDVHRIEATSYREEVSSISAKVLGLSNQGYMANDIWVSEWRTTIEKDSVRVSGEILRGVSIVGVEFDPLDGVSSPIPLVEYAVHGSIFNRGSSRIKQCFTIPAGERYRIFVGGVTDPYSPSWNSFHINEIGTGSPCRNVSDSGQWLATLEQ